MVGDTYFCGHVSRPTAGRCNECAQVRANAKPLRKLAQSNSKSEDTLADMLLELGFANKPGSQKGRQFSQRYYVAELKKAILHWHKAEIAKLFEQIRSEADKLAIITLDTEDETMNLPVGKFVRLDDIKKIISGLLAVS